MNDTYIRKAFVTNVIDGDTIDVEIDLGFRVTTELRLRLNRVNTPERGKEGWHEATNYTGSKLLWQEVHIQTFKDVADGGFGRFLAEVTFVDQDFGHQLNFNDLLLLNGYAVPYKRNTQKKEEQ